MGLLEFVVAVREGGMREVVRVEFIAVEVGVSH